MEEEDTHLVMAQIIELLRDVIMYPSEMISILNQISYKPATPKETSSPTKFNYFMDIYNNEGPMGFTRGMLSFILIHYLYVYIWTWTNDSSDRNLTGIFGEEILSPDYPSQLKLQYRLTKMFVRECAAAICTHPIHVLQTRQVAQYVGKETKYSTFVFGLFQTYFNNGICGYFYGLLPRLTAIIILNSLIEIFDWVFECYVFGLNNNPNRNESVFNHFILNHREESKNFNKRFARLIGILICGSFDKITTNMEVDESCLEADTMEERSKYETWFGPGVKIMCRPPKRKELKSVSDMKYL